MGSYLSAEKSAATKTGLSLEEWRSRRQSGQRHCFRCRTWHPLDSFSVDKSRAQGRTASCKRCSNLATKASRYGLSVEQARALLLRSGGACELCGRRSRKLVIDHAHDTGLIRGVLCNGCNVAIGLLGDDPAAIRKAADYVERHRG
jgi:hypothetical protein